MKAVIISNPEKFKEKKKKFQEVGTQKIHVISDFDRTLTYGLTEKGKRTGTVISMIRSDPKYLGKEYMNNAIKLFDKYHPIEINPNISLKEKNKKMHEWWRTHFDLIIQSNLTKKIIKQVIKEKPLNFRKGSEVFLSKLNNLKIPFIILSAGPGDMIEAYLEKENLNFPKIKIIGNKYSWKKNKAIKIQEPIIHSFNKKEISLTNTQLFKQIKNRKYVILLGDSLGDTEMAEGFSYKEIIKIGFLNTNIKENLKEYKKKFDIILTGDQNFAYVNKLFKEIIQENN